MFPANVEQAKNEFLAQSEQLHLIILDDEGNAKKLISPDEALAISSVARDKLDGGDAEKITWLEDYLILREKYGWDWRVAAYIAWETTPASERYPKTQQALATEILGLTSDRTIRTWREKNPAIDAVIGIYRASPLLKYRDRALHTLGTMAAERDTRANSDRRLFFEMTRDYTPRQDVNAVVAPAITSDEMSQAQAKAKKLREELNGG